MVYRGPVPWYMGGLAHGIQGGCLMVYGRVFPVVYGGDILTSENDPVLPRNKEQFLRGQEPFM